MFLTDTCFWTHVQDLYTSKKIDLRIQISQLKWGFTREVSAELDYHIPEPFVPKSNAYIIPLNNLEYDGFLLNNPFLMQFDKADQTLLAAAKRDSCTIITDDGSLYLEALALGISTMRLPHFTLFLTKEGMLSKKQMYQIIRYWESINRYLVRDLKKWKQILNKIQ